MRCLSLLSVLLWGFLFTGCGDDDTPDATPNDADVGVEDADASLPDAEVGPTIFDLPDEREACADRNPLNNVYFGDLHVHTRYSFDAAAYDVRTGPLEAYRFAMGEPLPLPPYDADGNPTRTLQLDRPLDFAAVTDHAELIDATSICTDPESAGYDSNTCQSYRDGDESRADFGEFINSIGLLAIPQRVRLCRANPDACLSELNDGWRDMRESAEAVYDRSASCDFTSLIGYEWTGSASAGGVNIHRNILFANNSVLRKPISYVDAYTPERLWNGLTANCLEAEGDCDVIGIPHNSNLSTAQMFKLESDDGQAYDVELAQKRARLEPLMEIYQHKGASECAPSIQGDPLSSEDELCDFEIQYGRPCEAGETPEEDDCTPYCDGKPTFGFLGGCFQARDYARGALRDGLAEGQRLGVNPLQLGFIASSDTHSSAAGYVSENDWVGHVGNTDDDPEERLEKPVRGVVQVSINRSSPGGLAAVWAEENSRPALFAALKRRETYGTSGPRMTARVFGGFSLPSDICSGADFAQQGYDNGVPMGGEVSGTGTFALALSIMRDPMGQKLQHAQVVKGWVDSQGTTFERVYDVVGDRDNGATVDLATCQTNDVGVDSLCSVWEDPDFDPAVPAFYYVRAFENPSCRWSRQLCNGLDVDCATVPSNSPLSTCCDTSLSSTIQERIWTSPIWYLPQE